MFRNPFDSWTNSLPKPKKFGMPNQKPSTQNQIFSQPDMHPWRNTFFDDTTGPPDPTQVPEEPKNEWGDYLREMRDIYTKQGPAATAYGEHLQNLPQYQKPGGWHKFGSALVGAATGMQQGAGAGWQAGQEALHLPYRKAMDEWSTKEQALGRQSEIEDKSTGRRLAFMKEVREVAKDEQEWKKIMKDYDMKNRQFDADETYRRAQIQNWRDQGYREVTDKQGNTIFVNPRTGEKFNAGPSSKITDWDLTRSGQAISRAGVDVSRANVTERQRENTRNELNDLNIPISPYDQSVAGTSAYSQTAASNPDYHEFVTDEGVLVTPEVPKNHPTWRKYENFLREAEAKKKEILGARRAPPIIKY